MKKNSSFKISVIHTAEDQQKAHDIRQKVFVEEQNVSREEEYDEYDTSGAYHYLATAEDGKGVGTCRWRLTEKGYKLERFAVLKEYRSQSVGSALLKRVIEDIYTVGVDHPVYLHAQTKIESFYARHGFFKKGDIFYEANIPHYLMYYSREADQ